MKLFSLRIVFQAVASLAGLGISILTARSLGPEGKGVLSIALLIPFFVATVASLGMNDATSYLHHRRGLPLESFAGASVKYVAIIGLPLTLMLFYVLNAAGPDLWYGVFDVGLITIISLLFLAKLAIFLGRGLLRADGRYNLVMASDAIEVVAPLLILLVFIRTLAMEPAVAAIAFLGASLLALLLIAITSARYYRKPMELGAWRAFLCRVLPYGFRTQLRFAGAVLIQRINFVVVGGMLGLGSVGLYAVASSVAEVLTKIPDAASWIITPEAAGQDEDEAHRLTMRYARWVLSLTAIGALVLGLASTHLITFLFDTDFSDAAPTLVTLLAGVVALSYSRVLEASLIGRGGAMRVAVATWLGGAVLIILDILLIPRHGLIGAGLAASGGYVVNAILVTFFYRSFEASDEG